MVKKLTEEKALELISSTEALHEGHFVLASGLHSGHFVSKDDVSTIPDVLEQLAHDIAEYFWETYPEVVAAPAVGAIALGNRVAENRGLLTRSIFAEQEGDKFVFRRGYSRLIQAGTKVLVVEDVITTGKTTRAMIEAVNELGGKVVGVGLIWNRGQEDFEVPVFACVNKAFPNFDPEKCPLCCEGIPIDTQVNKHGQEFLDKYEEDPAGWPANRK